MTDNDIIKALEICGKGIMFSKHDCKKCPYYTELNCETKCKQNALDLINRQKAEIERLQKHNTEYARKHYNDGRAEAITEFAERLKGVYINDKRYDRPNPHTLLIKLFVNIDQIAKEMKGE